jgi:membrane-bound serine protease (ClpP class)
MMQCLGSISGLLRQRREEIYTIHCMARWLSVVFAATYLATAVPPSLERVRAQEEGEASQGRPIAYVADFEGIIHPISAEYLSDVIDRADTSDADVVVFVLRTPGGLVDSTRTIVSRMITSRAPVVVFVGPSGARAASAGFVLTIAADVAVMAPGTHIGAAHPVGATGGEAGETVAEKAASDMAAYVRSLAEARRRNITLSEEAVLESRAFTDSEALKADPPLIDFIASDVDDVLRQLDGRLVRRFDGREITMRTANAEIRRVEMTRRQQFLSAIAHPQIAVMLLTLGMLGLTVELWNPGAIVPGIAGGLCLLLAFFAFQILPVDTTGLLLVLFGLALLVAELMVPSFGALGIGGAIALLFGFVMLTDTVPGVQVGYELIAPLVLGFAGLVLFLGRLAVKAHRQQSATGAEGMVGRIVRARTGIEPDAPGRIDVHGEIWRATSDVPIAAGQAVRVAEVNGLTLRVEPVDGSTRQGDGEWKS